MYKSLHWYKLRPVLATKQSSEQKDKSKAVRWKIKGVEYKHRDVLVSTMFILDHTTAWTTSDAPYTFLNLLVHAIGYWQVMCVSLLSPAFPTTWQYFWVVNVCLHAMLCLDNQSQGEHQSYCQSLGPSWWVHALCNIDVHGWCALDRLWEFCIHAQELKRPTLTRSASCSSRDKWSGLVAPRDDGKSPRGQDWGPPSALLRLYILHRSLAVYTLDWTICYAIWLLHESYMRIAGVSVQPCNGIEANHEGKVR